MTGASLDLDIFKDIPGYKGILKAVLKYQIQLLVEQLCEHGGEESVLLSANVTEGTLSHLGSEAGKGFLTDNNDVKRQYLGYCLKAHQKRKSEFMSPSPSHEDIQSVKLIRSNPESVLSYPVHKKPYYRVQRRNTRIRSGGKQFSSFYSKAGLNRPTLQKIAASGGYMVSGENPYQRHSNETMCQIESPRQHETLKTQYESQRSEEQGQSSDVVVKTEIQTNDNNSSEENVTSQNKPEVTVKVEPSDNIDEAGDKVVSAVISEDIQTFGDGMGHQFSPNTSMETEDSFSEGNQSFEFLDDETFFKKYSEQRRAQKYTPNDVMKAIQAVREGTNRFRAGKLFGIPRSTMFRLVDKYGRIKNNCFMAPVQPQMMSSGSFDQQHPSTGLYDSRDLQYVVSAGEHSFDSDVKPEVGHYDETPSSSTSGSVPLPVLSPEFSKISPEIQHVHSGQIPTVVQMNQVNENIP